MPIQLEFGLHFEMVSGFHITGDRAELWTDKVLIRDWYQDRMPVVPATSIKGWLRENAERILRAMGQKVCDSSQPSSICGACLVCQVFGHPKRKSSLFLSDGKVISPLTDTRTSVSLSRRRKTAYEERLFTTEVAWSRILEVSGRGFFPTHQEAKQAAALIWLAAKTGFALGASRSRGLGWLRLVQFEFKWDGVSIPEQEIQMLVNEWWGEGNA